MSETPSSPDSHWTLYLIETESGRLYTGITTDLERRFQEHLNGKRGARFFNTSRPMRIVHTETFPDRAEASRREYEIKHMTRKQKLMLVGQGLKGASS